MSHLELMTDDIYSPSPLISFLEVASPVSSCCCCSGTTQSCPALCDPMDCSTPAFPVLHYFTKFAQTHVQLIDNAIQSSHPLLLLFFLPYSFPALVSSNLSALGIRWPKYWSFSFSISLSNEYSGFPLRLTGLISLQSKGLSRVFSKTTVQKNQFFGAQPSLSSSSHIHT